MNLPYADPRLCLIAALLTSSACAFTGPVKLDASHWQDVAEGYDVEILRDTWGVPHIRGATDPDAAFGLAWAHAEDDFKTIQTAFLAATGRLGPVIGKEGASVDYLVQLLRVLDYVEEGYERDLSPETRALCEAYADGLNAYAALHPEEVTYAPALPFRGQDVVAGFVFKAPFFFGLDKAIAELFEEERARVVSEGPKKGSKGAGLVDTSLASAMETVHGVLGVDGALLGSNTFAVGPERTEDGSTYLAVNSHQPWEGLVAWYEAHVYSEEGWDMVGGLFPGMPIIGHGHNRDLGYAFTVNRPDLIDVYLLTMDPDDETAYLLDGERRALEVEEITLKVKLGPFLLPVKRDILRSVHGPAVEQPHGTYAISFAGEGDIRHVEQWYRLNKATSFEEWQDAMEMGAIASLNVGYADGDGHIAYRYNARLPHRNPGWDYSLYLPGDTSETQWTGVLPMTDLPQVVDPPSGFIQNCNSTPFQTTDGPGNPDPTSFDPNFGIETHMTNRALRAHETFGADESITWADFKAHKFDIQYSKDSFVGQAVAMLGDVPIPEGNPLLGEALEVVSRWDLNTSRTSREAALALMTLNRFDKPHAVPDVDEILPILLEVAEDLKAHHGRVDPEWGQVNRLRRGGVDVPLEGGPDTIYAVRGKPTEDGGQLVGYQGDSYVLLVRWAPDGSVTSEALHQYGSATLDESSPHFADQVPLFQRRETRPVWMDEDDIRANLERAYRPGVP